MSSDRHTLGLALRPLDVLLFRGGHPMVAGWQVTSGLPLPQTLAGALRTWLLRKADCDFDRFGRNVRSGATLQEAARDGQPVEVEQIMGLVFRGPWLAQEDSGVWAPLVAAPANLLHSKEDAGGGPLSRSDPLTTVELPGWRPMEDGMRPLWSRGSEPLERAQGFLTLLGLGAYLAGGVPDRTELIGPDELFGVDRRTGIAVGPATRTVEEGRIYSAGYLALREGVGFYAEIDDATGVVARLTQTASSGEILSFGGDGKRCAVEIGPSVMWPEAEPAQAQGQSLLLTTPAPVARGISKGSTWVPGAIAGNVLSAAVPGYRAFSGWDLALRGPKPTRFAIEAGTVYFLAEPLAAFQPPSLCGAEDAALGWGHVVKGVWNHV